MEGFCRGCLIKYNDPAELLQYTEKNRRLFVYSTGLQVKNNDTFIFQLCKDCYINMKQSCKFKKQCRTADKKFKYYLSLKDADDGVDFCTFLKNDDSIMFRFPLSGNNTPANQRKDDDNASICTSIGNFMTDLLQGEEMPDTEARIIKQVIEEEADVLEDSLDSYWLQDDVSIDPDFGVDFNFSPFSTPHSVNRDHCYTPKRLSDQPAQNFINVAKKIMSADKEINYHENNINDTNQVNNENLQTNNENHGLETALDNDFYTENLLQSNEVKNNVDINFDQNYDDNENYDDFEPISNDAPILDALLEPPQEIESQIEINHVGLNINIDDTITNSKNYYMPNEMIDQNTDDVINHDLLTETVNNNIKNGNIQCTIDRNLEEALKNNVKKEVSLEDLLASPTVFPGVYAPSTPTIDNIIFDVKLDLDNNNSDHNVGQHIEKFHNIDSDIKFDDFFNKVVAEYDDDDFHLKVESTKKIKEYKKDSKQVDEPVEVQYVLEDCYCKLCNKKYNSLRALKIHFAKSHHIKLPRGKVTRRVVKRTCDYCAKEYTDVRNFVKHIKRHMKPKPEYQCHRCKLTFSTLATLHSHMNSHIGRPQSKPTRQTDKKYCCNICGSILTTSGNYALHMRRHNKIHTFKCERCDRGFFTKPEFTIHMRTHTGERPFKCSHCPRAFSRRHCLVKHVWRHTGEKPFECERCHTKFVKKESMINHFKKSKRCSLNEHNNKDKPYECYYCHRTFVKRQNFINHQNTSSKCVKLKGETLFLKE